MTTLLRVLRVVVVATATLMAACTPANNSTNPVEASAPLPTQTSASLPEESVTTTNAVEDSTTTSPTSTTTTGEPGPFEISLTVQDGKVEGEGRIKVKLGTVVALTVHSDVADEAHLHGYDLSVEVAPDKPGVLEFAADIPGVFEFELEASRVLLAELLVES